MLDIKTKEEIQEEGSVVVDFWAPWCGPCRAMLPHVEELSKAFSDKVSMVKCNVDDSPELTSFFNIKTVPTLVFIRNGKEENRLTGLSTKAQLEQGLQNIC